jgi:hypothetical protein
MEGIGGDAVEGSEEAFGESQLAFVRRLVPPPFGAGSGRNHSET